MTTDRTEPLTRHEIGLDDGRAIVIVVPTKLTKLDIKKIRVYVEALEKIAVIHESQNQTEEQDKSTEGLTDRI